MARCQIGFPTRRAGRPHSTEASAFLHIKESLGKPNCDEKRKGNDSKRAASSTEDATGLRSPRAGVRNARAPLNAPAVPSTTMEFMGDMGEEAPLERRGTPPWNSDDRASCRKVVALSNVPKDRGFLS